MAYTNLTYKLADSNRFVEAIGEYTLHGEEYILVETKYGNYDVYTLNDHEELVALTDEDLANRVIRAWRKETYDVDAMYSNYDDDFDMDEDSSEEFSGRDIY